MGDDLEGEAHRNQPLPTQANPVSRRNSLECGPARPPDLVRDEEVVGRVARQPLCTAGARPGHMRRNANGQLRETISAFSPLPASRVRQGAGGRRVPKDLVIREVLLRREPCLMISRASPFVSDYS